MYFAFKIFVSKFDTFQIPPPDTHFSMQLAHTPFKTLQIHFSQLPDTLQISFKHSLVIVILVNTEQLH